MKLKKYIKFNCLEWVIFDHRWSLLDDCIAECLDNDIKYNIDYKEWPKNWQDEITVSEEFYNVKTKKTKKYIPSGWGWGKRDKPWKNWIVRMDVTDLNKIDKYIISDAVYGTTWFADREEFVFGYHEWVKAGKPKDSDDAYLFRYTPGEHIRAARSIERKFKRIGIDTRFPA